MARPSRRLLWIFCILGGLIFFAYVLSYVWLRHDLTLVHYNNSDTGHVIAIDREYGRGALMGVAFTAGPLEYEKEARRISHQGETIEAVFYPLRVTEAAIHSITHRGEQP